MQSPVIHGGTEALLEAGGRTYRLHKYESQASGQFLHVERVGLAEYLVVAGGGGGGSRANAGGGGGGGGGVLAGVMAFPLGHYDVTVGGGGVGAGVGAAAQGGDGQDSKIGGLLVAAGGGGGGVSGSSETTNGRAGGSGGGAGGNSFAPASGGAGGPGGDSGIGTSGVGGPGILSSITGVELDYGSGGGGGGYGAAAGGPGAGAGSSTSTPSFSGLAGTVNRGGGGGGGGIFGGNGAGGNGSRGVIYVRYPIPRLLQVDNDTLAAQVRAEVIERIWRGEASYPTAGADSVETGVADPLNSSADNLARVDKLTIDLSDDHFTGTVTPHIWRPTVSNGKLVMHAHGHGTTYEGGDHGDLIRALVDEGYTVCGVLMIGGGSTETHNAYPWPTENVNHLRYFLEAHVRALNELEGEGFTAVYQTGKSGGAWTVSLMAALDTRITRSAQIAGSAPLYMADGSRDFEQFLPGIRALDALPGGPLDYTDLYAMCCSGGRRHLQIQNTEDACCFNAATFATGPSYEADVQAAATAMGGSYELFWDEQTTHTISSVAIAKVIDFLDAE